MISPKEITFVIPIYNLKEHRINNLKFVLPYILKTGCEVIVAEQTADGTSSITDLVGANVGLRHLIYKHTSSKIHKTGIINWVVKNHVSTKYVWVNDVDFYMKFSEGLNELSEGDFIQPYSAAKKLSGKETEEITSGNSLMVSYEDEAAEYLSLYGALSFIFKKEKFIEIGGMDETLFGWAKEDEVLSTKIAALGYGVEVGQQKGIHLWHPPEIDSISSTPKDVAIITCHFNWTNYVNPVRNLNRFLDEMAAEGIPVYGVELSLNDTFVTRGRENWKHIHVDETNVCFQKEACVNLVEKIVPEKYKKIAWIDSDLYFTNRNWYQEMSVKLNKYKLVQLYENGSDTDKFGKITSTISGIVAAGGPRLGLGYFGHPGGAWAAQRSFWENGGLYCHSFMGAGDTLLVNTIYNVYKPTDNEPTAKIYLEWKRKIQSYVNKSEISYVSGRFVHEWHGDKSERGYASRSEIVARVDIDKNVSLDSNGLIKIQGVPASIYDDIFSYFNSRLEDGNIEKSDYKKDMAVVAVHFNWAGFETPIRNLNRFILEMESDNIPLYGVELSLTGKFVTERYPNWIKIRVKKENVCFQKEACINLVEKFIPEKYKKIAWIDHDIYFNNKNWYRDTSEKLNGVKIVQMFSEEIFTDKMGEESSNIPSLMKVGGPIAETLSGRYLGTPGAALAARRDLWRVGGGLYPYCIMGGGDTVFLYTIYKNSKNPNAILASGEAKKFKHYDAWKNSIRNWAQESCSFIDGTIVHSWHGDVVNRLYTDRHAISGAINWEKSLSVNKHGLIQIKNVTDATYDSILKYFKGRNEDGKI